MTRERFTLNDLEKRTPLWLRLREHLLDELSQLRSKNDSPSLDERETARIRGQIEALKKLLAAEREHITGD